MTLKEYVKKNKLTTADLARKTQTSQSICWLWIHSKRIPSVENMRKIFLTTGGQVTPNDFYGIGI